MSFRAIGLAMAIPLMLFGCAASRSAPRSNSRVWEIQKERQQRAVRDAGRIGYIGNDGSSGL